MPKQFTGSVDAPSDIRFGADEYVDTSNALEQLPAAADAFAKATSSLVLRSYSEQQQSAINQQEELYTEARAAKRGMYEGALAKDTVSVNEYAQKLEDLKIAERQGAITGSNSQIRQETLLKSFINRFPHLEEEFRQKYSSTRARAQAEREQFKDPIEKGMDALLERSYAQGRNPVRQIEYEQAKADLEMKKEMLSYRSMLGQSIQNDVDILFENQGRHGAIMDVHDYISSVVNMADQGGTEIDAEQAKADLRTRAELYKRDWRIYLADVISKSETPSAVLSKEYVDGKMKEIDQIYNDQISTIDSFDTLRQLKRASEITQYKTLNEVAEVSPLIGFFVKAAPDVAIDQVLKGYDRTKRMVQNGGMAAIQVLKDQSPNYDSEIIDFHLKMMGSYFKDGRAQQKDFDRSMNLGAGLAPSGSTQLDAARVNLVTQTVLENPGFDPEVKANAVRSAVESEKQLSRPGEYLAPSRSFYTDPIKRKTLQENPRAKQEMTQTLENDAPGILNSFQNVEGLSTLRFATQLEQDLGMREPWLAYPTGGPWSSTLVSNPRDMNRAGGTWIEGLGRLAGSPSAVVAALNNSYWVYRTMHGPQAAEQYANDIQELIEERLTTAKEEAEEEEVPTVDLTD
jgi:hypothetical protein